MYRTAVFLFLAASAPAAADDPFVGQWQGTIAIPGRPLLAQIDLERDRDGAWSGSATLPELKLRGAPLAAISSHDGRLDAQFAGDLGGPGDTKAGIQAELGQDGVLRGRFNQAGLSAPMELHRSGPADVQRPRRSTPVPKAMEGTWKGDFIGFGGYARHVTLSLRNQDTSARVDYVVVGKNTTTAHVNYISANEGFLELTSGEGIGYEGRLVADKAGTPPRLIGSLQYAGIDFPLTLERTP